MKYNHKLEWKIIADMICRKTVAYINSELKLHKIDFIKSICKVARQAIPMEICVSFKIDMFQCLDDQNKLNPFYVLLYRWPKFPFVGLHLNVVSLFAWEERQICIYFIHTSAFKHTTYTHPYTYDTLINEGLDRSGFYQSMKFK